MKMNELYDKIPSASRNLFSVINQYVLGNIWTTGNPAPMTAQELNALSNNMWALIWNKDESVNTSMWRTLYSVDVDNITAALVQSLVLMEFTTYKDKWTKLWQNVYMQTYNPIWNVDGEESTTRTYEYGKRELNTKDFEIEHEHGTTDTETVTNNITDNDVYGFNSATPVGASKSTNNGSRSNVGSGSDTDIHSGTDDYQQSGVDTERITHTRQGNIGVTKSTELLDSELELREKFNYFAIVTKDIIRELTNSVY